MSFNQRRQGRLFRVSWGACLLLSVLAHLFLLAGTYLVPEEWLASPRPAEVRRQVELYRSLRVEKRKALPGLHPKRAEIVLAGACIVEAVLDLFGADHLVASDRGLRYGVLEALLAGEPL